jgi:hypothetical protein
MENKQFLVVESFILIKPTSLSKQALLLQNGKKSDITETQQVSL